MFTSPLVLISELPLVTVTDPPTLVVDAPADTSMDPPTELTASLFCTTMFPDDAESEIPVVTVTPPLLPLSLVPV